jgi:hypothetical protein
MLFAIMTNPPPPDNLIIKIPPFFRKWLILPGKYIQVLSISHKIADYFAFPKTYLTSIMIRKKRH